MKKNTRFDWIFISLTLGYIMLMYGSLLEAFFSPHKLSPLISIQGIIVYCLGLGLRWWSIKSLGFGWNLFISKKSIKKSVHLKLVKNGPYALVRHPIYIGTIFEILSIPIIANALFSLIFAIATIIPLLIIRALLEEEILVRYFKNRYAEYKKRTGFLMPKLF
ncbi:MAG: isoprenylcysteine carboxylmethyltransferase family protein [Candidatus Omnitrophota bacterium]|nr:isoprenylcysteine carboxylmethyltransferase family protein [Candidatus Omnitrophota bacterium]